MCVCLYIHTHAHTHTYSISRGSFQRPGTGARFTANRDKPAAGHKWIGLHGVTRYSVRTVDREEAQGRRIRGEVSDDIPWYVCMNVCI
jgi:hypothetical protein